MKLLLFKMITIILLYSQQIYRIEGQFSIVEYPQEFQSVADSLLKRAELTIPRLAKLFEYNLQHFRTKKVHIYFTDAPDISNGFAMGNVVTIYATSSSYLRNWTSTANWYTRVLNHELVHHLMFRKTDRLDDFFGIGAEYVFGGTPRWFAEGLAQYYAEEWDFYRGDVRLKQAVLNSNLTYATMKNNLSYAYPVGHGFVRFLADQYGDSTLVNLMGFGKDNAFNFLGLELNTFNFEKSFKETYKEPVAHVFQDFIRHMVIYYGDKLADLPVRKSLNKSIQFGAYTQQIIPLHGTDSLYLISSQQNENHHFLTAHIVEKDSSRLQPHEFISNDYHTLIQLSPNQRYLAYGRLAFTEQRNETRVAYHWFVYDRETKKERLVSRNKRARFGAFIDNDYLVLANLDGKTTQFISVNIHTFHQKTIYETPMPVGKLLSFNKKLMFESQKENGFRDLMVLENNQLRSVTNSKLDVRNPVLLNDDQLLYNVIEQDVYTVHLLNLNTNETKRLIYDQNDYILEGTDPFKETVLFKQQGRNSKAIITQLPIKQLLEEDHKALVPEKKTAYTTWKTRTTETLSLLHAPDTTTIHTQPHEVRFPQGNLLNMATFIFPEYNRRRGFSLTGTTLWLEALGRQVLTFTGSLAIEKPKQSLLGISHSLKFRNLTLNSSMVYVPVILKQKSVEDYTINRVFASTMLSKWWALNQNSRHILTLSAGVSANHSETDKTYPELTKTQTYYGSKIQSSYHYLLPTSLAPLLPKRLLHLDASFFTSVAPKLDFQIFETNLKLGTNLYFEPLGIQSSSSYIKYSGDFSEHEFIGIDRFYTLNIPRDAGYTRTVRGVRTDYIGNELFWNATELRFIALKNTPFKAFFLPINSIYFIGFSDYASIKKSATNTQLWSIGAECAFQINQFSLSLGFADYQIDHAKKQRSVYARLSLNI